MRMIVWMNDGWRVNGRCALLYRVEALRVTSTLHLSVYQEHGTRRKRLESAGS